MGMINKKLLKSSVGLGGLALLLSGCLGAGTPQYWQHPERPSSQWSSDLRACKRAVQRHLGLDPANHADQGLSQFNEGMRQFSLAKDEKRLVSRCMRKAGYTPIR